MRFASYCINSRGVRIVESPIEEGSNFGVELLASATLIFMVCLAFRLASEWHPMAQNHVWTGTLSSHGCKRQFASSQRKCHRLHG